jgi:hypothetical protein
MEYTIVFGGALQDVTITTSGLASVEGLIGFVTDLVANPRYRPGMSILVDHTALDARPLTATDIRTFAMEVVRFDEQIGPSRVAIVVPDPLTFGFARMYELYAESAAVRSRVFYAASDAHAWLESGDAPDEQPGART